MDFITFTLDHYANCIVGLCLVTVIWLYFRNNPLQHSFVVHDAPFHQLVFRWA